jgi:DNA-binding beta-propeller fold protein YncE
MNRISFALTALTALLLGLAVGWMPVSGAQDASPTPALAGGFEVLWEYRPDPGSPDGLSHAYGVGIDPRGNVWVADGNHDRLVILAPDGTHLETWGTSGAGEGQFEFNAPESGFGVGYGDVTFDEAGNIYVLDTGNHRVQKFAPDRSFQLAWGSLGEGDGQFIAAGGIAVGPDGVVYVSDERRADVQRFDADGRFLGTTGPLVTGEGDRVLSGGLAVAGDGTIWIADFRNHQIQHVDPEGAMLTAWGRHGIGPDEVSRTNDVALDAAGRVYVIEDTNPRLQVFSPDGRLLAWIQAEHGDPGYLSDGHGVAVDAAGIVYVSDRDSVQAFRLRLPQEAA